VRIATHGDFVRVVVDLDAPAEYSIESDGSIAFKGMEGESAVLNATPSQAPLKRVTLAPGSGGARMTFETTFATTTKAFTLAPDKEGGNRIVVDLYPKSAPPPAPAAGAPGPSARPPVTPSGTTAAVDPAAAAAPIAPAIAAAAAAVPEMPPEPAPEMPGAAQAAAPIAAQPETSIATPAPPTPAPAPPLPAEVATIAPLPVPPSAPLAGAGFSDETLRAERALDRGDARDACNRAGNALKANPNDLRALAVLGGCRLALHDAIGAKGAYTLALQADPSFDRARVGLATADDMLGDRAGARAELAKVLGHDAPPEDLKRLIGAFKELAPATAASN
jgi:hypothetical protein